MSRSIAFCLDVVDDWPPVGSESLPFDETELGIVCLDAPLFVKDLSVGDKISIDRETNGYVVSWHHVERSKRSTVWLLRLQKTEAIEPCLENLRRLGCNTVSQPDLGCYSVDVPEEITLAEIDAELDLLDEDEVAVAFPSLRHN